MAFIFKPGSSGYFVAPAFCKLFCEYLQTLATSSQHH